MIRSIPFLVCLLAHASAQVVSVADPYSDFPKDKTVVWSPLFQATWDTMNDHMGGKPKKIEPANELMKRLDSFKWNANAVMPDGCWKTWAGKATPDFLNSVNKQAAELTGEAEGPFTLKNPSPDNIAAFGLLNRVVEFQKPFIKSTKQPLLFGKEQQPIRFFGTLGETTQSYADSTRVLAYRPIDGSHALEVSCKGTDDKLIVYLPSAPQDFVTACKWLREWRKKHADNKGQYGSWNESYLHQEDDVRIPYVTLNAKNDFQGQLQSGRYYGKTGDPWTIARAEQKTKFVLSEKGAEARVEVSIEGIALGEPQAPPPVTPRKFIYDRPFFIFLWREKAEWPYIGVWVGDTSALQKMN